MTASAQRYSGLTWDHPRGYDALAAAARASSVESDLDLSWAKQPLEGFESRPIAETLRDYDLVVLDHPHLGDAIDSGQITPLESVFERGEIEAWRGRTIGAAMASYQVGASSYALPLDVAAQVVASNPARLAQLPDTWDDVLSIAGRLPVALSLAGPHALLTFFSLCLSLGAEPGGRNLVPDAEATEALRIMQFLYAARPIGSERANPIELLDAMSCNEDLALVPLVFGYVTYADPGRDWPIRFSAAPRFGSGRRGSVLGGTGIGVSARTSVSVPLLDHLRWLMREDTQAGFIPAHSGQPSARAAWLDAEVNWTVGNFYVETLATVETAWVRPRFAGYVTFQNAAADRLRAWLHEGSVPATFLKAMRALWIAALKRAEPSSESEQFHV